MCWTTSPRPGTTRRADVERAGRGDRPGDGAVPGGARPIPRRAAAGAGDLRGSLDVPGPAVRRAVGRLRRRAQVPDAVEPLSLLELVEERRGGGADAHRDPRPDGARRHLRPARRRLPPLRHGPRVEDPPLREDALRQRLPPGALRPRARPHGRPPGGADRARDRGLGRARDDLARGGLLERHRRRDARPRGGLLRLDRRGAARGPGARRTSPSSRRSWASTVRRSSRGPTTSSTSPRGWRTWRAAGGWTRRSCSARWTPAGRSSSRPGRGGSGR